MLGRHLSRLVVLSALSIAASACGSSDGAKKDDKAPPKPTSYQITVDGSSVIGASKNKPYPGAALVDLRDGKRVEIGTEKELEALQEPLVWIEPSDPEIHFLNLRLEDASRFRTDKRGGQVLDKHVKAGARFVVRDALDRAYGVTIEDYTAGDRKVAAIRLRIDLPKAAATKKTP